MIAIADAGGTKTDWRILAEDTIYQYTSAGFNASFQTVDQLEAAIPTEVRELTFESVHFYVAGLQKSNTAEIQQRLQSELNSQNIKVYADTLAVARALLLDQAGWVGILGTGSAAIHFDGNQISDRKPSLGYILGDEGSGVDLGRRFVSACLRNHFPAKLNQMINDHFPELSEEYLLREVYQKGNTKAHLSGYISFLSNYQNEPIIYQLIEKAFQSYFDEYFADKHPAEMSFSGSIAFYFGNILSAVARKKSIRINRIIQSPIAGLTLYHQNHG